MKHFLLFFVLISINFSNLFAQNANDSITIQKNQFFYKGQVVGLPQLAEILAPNAEATKELKSARSAQTWASVFGTVGGVLIGYPIGTALGGGKANWTSAAVGAGLIVVAIPIANNASNMPKKRLMPTIVA